MLSIMIIGAVFFTYTATTAVGGNVYLAVYICYIVPDGKCPLRVGDRLLIIRESQEPAG